MPMTMAGTAVFNSCLASWNGRPQALGPEPAIFVAVTL